MSGAVERVFGVVLAGGASRRFGHSKALAEVGGVSLAGRSVNALRNAGLTVGVVTSDEDIGRALGIPIRPDIETGLGPIGGLWTALEWVEERGETAVFLLGCDMPLVTADLIRLVMNHESAALAVAPESTDGLQPLCALYRSACLSEIERRIRSDDRSLHGLLKAVDADVVSEERISDVADPATVFLNVNTEADAARATELIAATPGGTR